MLSENLPTEPLIPAVDTSVLFDKIADQLYAQGYAIIPQALPASMAQALYTYYQQLSAAEFDEAGIGRRQSFQQNEQVRTDKVCWITGESPIGQMWIDWLEALKHQLNRRLFMGLFSVESHFAYYQPGDFYKRHMDAFKGESNRVLSLVTYLNQDWPADAGGELVLYKDADDTTGIRVPPQLGTLVVFLSEEFPHEVRPASQPRHSIASWFRVNTSRADRVDPPR